MQEKSQNAIIFDNIFPNKQGEKLVFIHVFHYIFI